MLTRALAGSLRTLTFSAPRALPRKPIRNFPRTPSFISQRYESGWGYPPPPPPPRKPTRVVYHRWDPEEVKRAKPLFTDEQFIKSLRSPTTQWMLVLAGGSAVIFYYSNLETVPVSGRRRFNCFSDAFVEAEGERTYKKIMRDHANAILPDWDRRTKLVNKVMAKLIPASGLEHVNWEVHVIDSPEANAFVIPGGKVFVYSGLLPITKTEDGLAAVLGHEIAHNLARHTAEQMSSSVVIYGPLRIAFLFMDALGLTLGLGPQIAEFLMDLGFMMPASRKQESEADYIGLMMMAHSCYNPKEAVKVWERMEVSQKNHNIPEWMSTHPSNSSRIAQIRKWLPKAEDARSESDCSFTWGHFDGFQKSLHSDEWAVIFKS
ncbi:GPI anchored peptidase m48 [Diplocarpon rosae]|nr:GPI anchored peptidase m48 [Diplocarpon rosae]